MLQSAELLWSPQATTIIDKHEVFAMNPDSERHMTDGEVSCSLTDNSHSGICYIYQKFSLSLLLSIDILCFYFEG